ncbi:hypothetical protein DC363_06180 [Thalassorhabdomicrobium marinisediminis]|uniref:HTH lysR-type domain-containing protein n=1 Tax=Thalassorhabdomicrobium marinisediminis TaxID=2170577 RepID=A0A2T7FZ37_9RHOB|nr:hypothetical protein DC363_06180 [Thalassorhabdomicrobium marinisediminis]
MTTAAQMMAVTQPAVSRLIRDLEATLELELFTRTGAGLSATADAINFFSEVERSFVGLKQLKRAAQVIRQKREGFLHVAATGAFGVSARCVRSWSWLSCWKRLTVASLIVRFIRST